MPSSGSINQRNANSSSLFQDCTFSSSDNNLIIQTLHDDNQHYEKPAIVDHFNNSITILQPIVEYQGVVLLDAHRIYDETKWRTGFVTREDSYCILYIDETEVAQFSMPESFEDYEIVFNRHHYAYFSPFRDGFYINQVFFGGVEVQLLKIVGNYVWYIDSSNVLTMLILSEKTLGVITSVQHNLEGFPLFVCTNPYCPNECFIYGENSYFIRYDSSKKEFITISVVFPANIIISNACFIDESILVCDRRAYEFADSYVINIWDIPTIDGVFTSPEPGVLTGGFHNQLQILKFDGRDNFENSVEIVDDTKFLSKCEFSKFSCFGHFK
ncbi:hypothetical protein PCE1_004941 [Barthelona sp. PCE]